MVKQSWSVWLVKAADMSWFTFIFLLLLVRLSIEKSFQQQKSVQVSYSFQYGQERQPWI